MKGSNIGPFEAVGGAGFGDFAAAQLGASLPVQVEVSEPKKLPVDWCEFHLCTFCMEQGDWNSEEALSDSDALWLCAIDP